MSQVQVAALALWGCLSFAPAASAAATFLNQTGEEIHLQVEALQLGSAVLQLQARRPGTSPEPDAGGLVDPDERKEDLKLPLPRAPSPTNASWPAPPGRPGCPPSGWAPGCASPSRLWSRP